MCRKVPESLAHMLAGCSLLAQIKYMDRHIAALKVLFFEMLRDLKLANSFPPWYSRVEPKPMYESTDAQAFWDVPVYAEHTSFCLSQQGGCTSSRVQSKEDASCGNELPLVGQPHKEGYREDREVWTIAVGIYQTIPRLQDCTTERHNGHTGGMVQGAGGQDE